MFGSIRLSRRHFTGITATALLLASFSTVTPANAAVPTASSYFANFESGNSNVSTSQFSQTSSGIEASSFADHPGNIFKFQTNAGCLGGFKMTTSGVLFTSTQKPVVALDVYAPVAASINIKVEKSTNQNIKAAKMVKINAGWNLDVSVDFSTVTGWDPTNEYDVLTLFPGYNCNVSNGGSPLATYYVDNIQANGGDKPTPTINSNPTASDITYGQSLANSTLSGGSASVNGAFAFTTPSTTPNAGTNNQDVTFTPTDSHNYRNATTTVSVKVKKATPTITTNPTASDITYGQDLLDSDLTGGVASVPGEFSFPAPGATSIPNAGTANQVVSFTPTDTANYLSVTLDVPVTVNKATPSITTAPTASDITYGDTLANSILSGGSGSVPGSFAFTSPTTAPNAGVANQSVTFTPTDSSNYNTTTVDVQVAVGKKTPSITTNPTASGITYGQSLADSILSGGVGSVAGSFTFTSPSTGPNAGTSNQSVTFTPSDTDNYAPVTFDVSVTVSKATPTVVTAPTASDITYGQTLADSTLSGGSGSVAGSFTFTSPSTAPNAGTADQNVTFTPSDTDNYNTTTVDVSVSVGKATPSVTTAPSASDITYNQMLADSTLSGGSGSVPGTFTFKNPTTTPNAGTADYEVVFTPDDSANYETITSPLKVSVTTNKAGFFVQAALPTNITYGQTLADSTLSGGSCGRGLFGSNPVPCSYVWEDSTIAPNAGSGQVFKVKYTATSSTNYEDQIVDSLPLTVFKATPTLVTAPTASEITYGQTLASSILSGGVGSVPGSFAFTTTSTSPNAGTRNQSVTFTPTDSSNYETISFNVSVTVNMATPTITSVPSASGITYGQTLANSNLTGGSGSVAGTFAFTYSSTAPSAGTANQSVTFTPVDTDNYTTATVDVSVTVGKATPTVTTAPVASAITLGQTLASSILSGGVASVPGTFTFVSASTAPALGVQTFTVIFTPADSLNFNATSVFDVQVNVKPDEGSPFIVSVDRIGYWSYVNFRLPKLANGKRYDRVAYRINGGKWVTWGLFSQSAQKLTGLKAKRNYSVEIRAHVAKGDWTVVSNSVFFFAGPRNT